MIRTLARSYSRSPRSVASQSRARQLSVGRLVATRDPAQLRDAERHCDLGHRSPLRPGGDEFAAKPRKQPQLEVSARWHPEDIDECLPYAALRGEPRTAQLAQRGLGYPFRLRVVEAAPHDRPAIQPPRAVPPRAAMLRHDANRSFDQGREQNPVAHGSRLERGTLHHRRHTPHPWASSQWGDRSPYDRIPQTEIRCNPVRRLRGRDEYRSRHLCGFDTDERRARCVGEHVTRPNLHAVPLRPSGGHRDQCKDVAVARNLRVGDDGESNGTDAQRRIAGVGCGHDAWSMPGAGSHVVDVQPGHGGGKGIDLGRTDRRRLELKGPSHIKATRTILNSPPSGPQPKIPPRFNTNMALPPGRGEQRG